MARDGIPWAELETLFLDVGNTLISVDFGWVARELAARGVKCEVRALERAEAANRPAVSEHIAALQSAEGSDVFSFFLRGVFSRTSLGDELPEAELDALVADLEPVLRGPGRTQRLWSRVLPGIPEALADLVDLGFELVVVSNADGSVEEGLRERGLRDHFVAVHDSHWVGYEKPDRRFFDHALAEAGARPERTLHVGDLYHADVVGARGAGIHALLLDPFDDWDEVDCEKLPDLPALVRRLAAEREG